MKRASSRVRAGAGSAIVLLIGLTWCLSPVSASEPSSTSVSPQNTAATREYLKDTLTLDRTLVGEAPASTSAEKAAVGQLGRECRGVLVGEPLEEPGPGSEARLSARARGALRRSELEQQTIDDELDMSLVEAIYAPDKTAIEAYEAHIAQLSWSNPKIGELLQYQAGARNERIAPSVANVCADMRAWAQSGFHALSQNSREFQTAQTASSHRTEPTGSIAKLLKPYENAADRQLIRETKASQEKLASALSSQVDGSRRLGHILGRPESPFEEQQHAPVLGHGRTAAGGSFVVRREVPTKKLFGMQCRHSVDVEIKEPSKGSGTFGSSSGDSVCLSGKPDSKPSGSCGDGVESIQTVVSTAVRSVRLQLSNGQTITSRVLRVPRGTGRPVGIYVQSVSGYKTHAVSLTELDAHGRPLKTLKVGFRCHREGSQRGPTFVTLARGTSPADEPFTIQGVLVHFGHNQTSFNLTLSPLGDRQDESASGSSTEVAGKKKAFSVSLAVQCPPHEFAIVYGILSAPADTVLAQTQSGLVALTKVELASSLHSEGPLVYGVFATLPSELIVRGADGSTLYTESFVARAKEETEFCEGYAES